MTYPLRYRIGILLVLGHLALVALGATDQGDFKILGRLAPVFTAYTQAAGADSSYGFFAPGVSGQVGVRFTAIDAAGRAKEVSLSSGRGGEADLRIGNIIDQFESDEFDAVSLQRALSSSLAGAVFGRAPEARKVVVELRSFMPVSMAEYRAGRRPDWKPVYQASYVRSQNLAALRSHAGKGSQ